MNFDGDGRGRGRARRLGGGRWGRGGGTRSVMIRRRGQGSSAVGKSPVGVGQQNSKKRVSWSIGPVVGFRYWVRKKMNNTPPRFPRFQIPTRDPFLVPRADTKAPGGRVVAGRGPGAAEGLPREEAAPEWK